MTGAAVRPLPRRRAQRLAALPVTYPASGETADTHAPDGYSPIHRHAVIGSGRARFAEAVEAVLSWQVQIRSGLTVHADSARVRVGVVAEIRLGPGPIAIGAPVRVVRMIDEPDRAGFAYGTLPGHPESGAEAFVVDLAPDDTVTFTVSGFSRPAGPLMRAVAPVAAVVQRRVTDRYLRALRRTV